MSLLVAGSAIRPGSPPGRALPGTTSTPPGRHHLSGPRRPLRTLRARAHEAAVARLDRLSQTWRSQFVGAWVGSQELLSLAQAVHDSMKELLIAKETPEVMMLGHLARFGHRKNKLVVQSAGWKGYSSRYPSEAPGDISPNASAVQDRAVCVGAIEKVLTSDSEGREIGVDPNRMIGIPHLSLVTKEGNIYDKELRAFQSYIEPILPDELYLGNPVVTLRTAPGKRGLQRFEITPDSEARITEPVVDDDGAITVPSRLEIIYPS